MGSYVIVFSAEIVIRLLRDGESMVRSRHGSETLRGSKYQSREDYMSMIISLETI